MKILIISATVTVVQILNAYLRYLPFSQQMTLEDTQKLSRRFLRLGALLFAFDVFIFYNFGITAQIYRLIFIFGALSFFVTSAVTIKEKFILHIFVYGMHGIWELILHGMAATANDALKNFFTFDEFIFQGILVIFFFALFWKVEKDFFQNLLATRYFFEGKFRWYNALLPLAVFSGTFLMMNKGDLIQPFKERLLRLSFPIFFFAMYRSINFVNQQLDKKNRQKLLNQILQQQLQNLRDYNLIQQENQKQLTIIRHDLRHNYRIISTMLKEKTIGAAIEYIQAQEVSIGKNDAAKNGGSNSILEVVILTYQTKSQSLGVKTSIEIQPAFSCSNENEFVILLSNLFDNAINAVQNLPPAEREISLMLRRAELKNFFEISNSCNEIFKSDENGLPNWRHGTGMKTLINFKEKFGAQIKFVQTDARLKISVTWENA